MGEEKETAQLPKSVWSLLYWIEGSPEGPERNWLMNAGLSHLATEDVTIERAMVLMEGPGKDASHRGTLFRPCVHGTAPENPCVYSPDTQTWFKCENGLWIGMENGHSYVAEDFVRGLTVDGSISIRMEDGNYWPVPQIPALPVRYRRSPDGTTRRITLDEHRAPCEAADNLFRLFTRQFDIPIDHEDARKWISQILGVNCIVGWNEVEILGLLGTRSSQACVYFILGVQKWKEIHEEHMRMVKEKNAGGAGNETVTPQLSVA